LRKALKVRGKDMSKDTYKYWEEIETERHFFRSSCNASEKVERKQIHGRTWRWGIGP
jgi:hypothetical protein